VKKIRRVFEEYSKTSRLPRGAVMPNAHPTAGQVVGVGKWAAGDVRTTESR